MYNQIEIGERIKKLKIASKIDNKIFAQYLDLNEKEINKLERGVMNINEDIINKISNLFCCPTSYILDGIDISKNYQPFNLKHLSIEEINALADINKIVINQMFLDSKIYTKQKKKY